MTQIVNIKQASKLTGLTAYALRKGAIEGRFPAFRSADRGKILFDLQLLLQSIAGVAMANVKQTKK